MDVRQTNVWLNPKVFRQHCLHVKFESDRTITVACIVPTRFRIQNAKVDLDLWPWDRKINRDPSLIINNFHVKLK